MPGFQSGKASSSLAGGMDLRGRGAEESTSGPQPEEREFESRRPYHAGV